MIESKKSLCTCIDHCRIGSLEKMSHLERKWMSDHCRIGSLEIHILEPFLIRADHCRIGSLEKYTY